MWYLLFNQYRFRCFSHRLWCFQLCSTIEEQVVTNALSSQSPIKAEEWGTSLHCHAHRTPLSVRQSCSPNKCPHPAVLHWRCRGKVSDYLTGKMRHLHQIINTLTDRRQRVLGEHCKHQLQRRDQRFPFMSAFTQEYVPYSISLRTEKGPANVKNCSWACNNNFWTWILD